MKRKITDVLVIDQLRGGLPVYELAEQVDDRPYLYLDGNEVKSGICKTNCKITLPLMKSTFITNTSVSDLNTKLDIKKDMECLLLEAGRTCSNRHRIPIHYLSKLLKENYYNKIEGTYNSDSIGAILCSTRLSRENKNIILKQEFHPWLAYHNYDGIFVEVEGMPDDEIIICCDPHYLGVLALGENDNEYAAGILYENLFVVKFSKFSALLWL